MSDCGTPSCSIKKAGCTAAYTATSGEISIDANFAVTIKRNIANGHGPTKICILCTSTANGATQKAKFDNWSIQQIRDCSTALTTKTPNQANPLVIPYNSGGDLTYEEGNTDLFENLEPIGCPVTECLLMNGGCTSVPGVSTNFWITPGGTGGAPWALFAKRDVEDGWGQITFCYKCIGTGFSKTTMVNWSIR